MCSSRMKDDGAITRRQMKQARRRAAADRRLLAAAARHRIPSGRRDRPRGQGGRRDRQPDRAVLRGALDHPAGAAARRRGGVAGGARAIRAERRPGRVPRPGGEPRRRDPQARSATARPTAASRPGWSRSSRCGCRSTTCIGRRRWWSRRAAFQGGYDSIRVGLRDGRILPLSTWGSRTRGADRRQRRGLRQGDRRHVSKPASRTTGSRRPRRTARAADGAGRDRGAGEQDRARARHGRRLLVSAEPAQPRDAGAPAARLLVQADDLSRRAQPAACSPTRWSRTRRSPIRRSAASTATPAPTDWWSPHNYDGGYAGTMTLRRALEQSKNLVTARLLDGGIADTPPESLDNICQLAIEAQRLSDSASATIRSCSAPSRCGRSTSRRSMPRSPTRADARRRT